MRLTRKNLTHSESFKKIEEKRNEKNTGSR